MYKLIDFLMVEDNPGDVRLTQEFFKEYKLTNNLNVVKDCMEALHFVRRQGIYDTVALPDIVLISIASLWKNAGCLMQHLKDDAILSKIPIVVLTSFDGEETSLDASLPVSLFIPKPLSLSQFANIVKQVDDFHFLITRDDQFAQNQ